jgi:hypothetical protein
VCGSTFGELIRRDAEGNTLIEELEGVTDTNRAIHTRRAQIDRRQFLFTSGSAVLLGLAG